MYTLIFFQLFQSMIVLAIVFFVFDFRLRGESFFGSKLPILIGALFPLYCLGYLLILFSFLKSVTVMDWISFVVIVLSLALIIKAKIDLKDWYTWPGQFKEGSELIKRGLYTRMRHPIYVGIFMFVLGTLITVVIHSVFILGVFVCLVGASLLAFTFFAAQQEEHFLMMELGDVYIAYRYEVNAFLPFKINKRVD